MAVVYSYRAINLNQSAASPKVLANQILTSKAWRSSNGEMLLGVFECEIYNIVGNKYYGRFVDHGYVSSLTYSYTFLSLFIIYYSEC